jgi:hypothetical protein
VLLEDAGRDGARLRRGRRGPGTRWPRGKCVMVAALRDFLVHRSGRRIPPSLVRRQETTDVGSPRTAAELLIVRRVEHLLSEAALDDLGGGANPACARPDPQSARRTPFEVLAGIASPARSARESLHPTSRSSSRAASAPSTSGHPPRSKVGIRPMSCRSAAT